MSTVHSAHWLQWAQFWVGKVVFYTLYYAALQSGRAWCDHYCDGTPREEIAQSTQHTFDNLPGQRTFTNFLTKTVTYCNLHSTLYRYPKHLLQTAATMEQCADSKKEFDESSTYQLWIQSWIGSSNLKIFPHTFLLWAARNLTTNTCLPDQFCDIVHIENQTPWICSKTQSIQNS
jgi:hypothetical protein